ncbi:MAG: DUF58 domain-containing protein [Oscillospiraceae bacterium]|nr:DUF58 domain-containing protein [Oscillospiraceae bacterium]
MVVFLFFTPIISVVFSIIASRKIDFSLTAMDSEIKKNEQAALQIKAYKYTFIPVPFISVFIDTSEHFEPMFYSEYKFSMSSQKETAIDLTLMPQICGMGHATLHNMYITDYLGIFKFKIKSAVITSRNIFIRPDIREIDDNKKLFANISSMMLDNDEDETTQSVLGGSSVPGYEYRDYIPGDSMKRINWKLSSKRRKLLVRKDEAASINIPAVYLDASETALSCSERDKLMYQEKVIECSLSLLLFCVNLGIECTYSYYYDGIFHEESVSTEEQIEKLSFQVCHSVFSDSAAGKLFSHKADNSKSKSINIIYTLNPAKVLNNPSAAIMRANGAVNLVVPQKIADTAKIRDCDIWAVSDEYSLVKYL